MTVVIPLTVAAKNEGRAIGACLDSLRVAIEHAQAHLPIRLEPLVVLDDCSDDTEAETRARGVSCKRSSGGKVEAQRAGRREGLFNVFSDADILLAPEALTQLLHPMLEAPHVEVTFAAKEPLRPRRRTPLARALHHYNRNHGYSSERRWFSGKLFAIRTWDIPRREELRRPSTPGGGFYNLAVGLLADDVYLSRRVLQLHGPRALEETPGLIRFRAPETLEGMYRYYRRLRMETERVDLLCPETVGVYARFGQRRQDLLASAPWSERMGQRVFAAALVMCRARYQWERWRHQGRAEPSDLWPAVEESKCL